MNLCSYMTFVFEASVWRMTGFMTMLTWMKIKTVIFHMANSITVLAFHNLVLFLWKRRRIWNNWRWIVMKKSNTLKLDGLWVIWSMKGHFLVISKTSYVFVMNNIFPRSNDRLGKCMLSLCTCMQICFWNEHLILINLNIIVFMTF